MERAARRLGRAAPANGGPAGRGGAGGRRAVRGRKMAEPETQLLLGVGLIGTGRPGGGEARAVAG